MFDLSRAQLALPHSNGYFAEEGPGSNKKGLPVEVLLLEKNAEAKGLAWKRAYTERRDFFDKRGGEL